LENEHVQKNVSETYHEKVIPEIIPGKKRSQQFVKDFLEKALPLFIHQGRGPLLLKKNRQNKRDPS
jgi:hypothetical protein